MSDTGSLTGKRIRGGVRPSKTYEEGRVCVHKSCETKISRYNRREFCHAHAPTRFPRLRGRIIPET